MAPLSLVLDASYYALKPLNSKNVEAYLVLPSITPSSPLTARLSARPFGIYRKSISGNCPGGSLPDLIFAVDCLLPVVRFFATIIPEDGLWLKR